MSQIAVWRGLQFGIVGFWHHGILCPDGYVIHFTDPQDEFNKGRAVILRSKLSEFIGPNSNDVYDVHYEPEEIKFSQEEIVQRAQSRMHQSGYNLLFNNCESFAQWCITGSEKSAQIDNYIRGVSRGVKQLGVAGIPVGLLFSAVAMALLDKRMKKRTIEKL